MVPFNLDELPPVHILREINHFKEWNRKHHSKVAVHRARVQTIRLYGPFTFRVGVKYDALLDWRHLESRYHAINAACRATSRSFWSALSALHDHAKKLGVKEVWIPRPCGTDVLVYDGRGLSHRSTAHLLEDAIPNPSFHAYVVKGADTIAALKLKEREDAYRRRAGIYRAALEMAVDARLKPFVEKRLLVNREYRHYHPGVFIFTNEDRRYVVQSDEQGTLKWKDDCEVFG